LEIYEGPEGPEEKEEEEEEGVTEERGGDDPTLVLNASSSFLHLLEARVRRDHLLGQCLRVTPVLSRFACGAS